MHFWTNYGGLTAGPRMCFLALTVTGAGLIPEPAAAQARYTGNFDLGLSTRIVSEDCYAGDTCTFGLAITNFGPEAFNGTLRLRGRFESSMRAILVGIGPAGWTCNQAGRDTVCTFRGGGIRPGRTLILETVYELPTGLQVYDLTYCANLEWQGPRTREPSVADIQRALAARGYNPGPIDGVPGFGTRTAIERFQAENGLEVTGWPTPEFNERLFAGAGHAGDNQPDNDRSCVDDGEPGGTRDRTIPDDRYDGEPGGTPDRTIPDDRYDGEPGGTPDRTIPDDRYDEELPPEDDAPPADEDDAEPLQDRDRTRPAPVPRVHTPAPDLREPAPAPGRQDHDKALSSFHETYRSGLHDKVLSQSRPDAAPSQPRPDAAPSQPRPDAAPSQPRPRAAPSQPRPDAAPSQPRPRAAPSQPRPDAAPSQPRPRAAPSQPRPDAAPSQPRPAAPEIHGKQTSEFHRKQLSTQHDKATSGAIVDKQPLEPVTSDQPEGEDDWKAEFHKKYKSEQHKKETSTLQEVHTKAISRVVHSKARSVITNPQFQGDTHDKALSAFHKKYRSQSHDTATSQAKGSGGQAQ